VDVQRVFRSVRDAVDAGFQIYDRFPDGYVVRTRHGDGWEFAVVALRMKPLLYDPLEH
jgi:hypothetical protein